MLNAVPLTTDERQAIIIAVQSVFGKLRNLHREVTPIYTNYGFTAPSAGVIARDLSEKIETAIVQHCATFSKGVGHCDLLRAGHDWEVKICKDSGLTINQSKQIGGEHYIVVNYTRETRVNRIWVLWDARDEFFSPRKANTNARSMLKSVALEHIEVLLARDMSPEPSIATAEDRLDRKRQAKANLPTRRKLQAS